MHTCSASNFTQTTIVIRFGLFLRAQSFGLWKYWMFSASLYKNMGTVTCWKRLRLLSTSLQHSYTCSCDSILLYIFFFSFSLSLVFFPSFYVYQYEARCYFIREYFSVHIMLCAHGSTMRSKTISIQMIFHVDRMRFKSLKSQRAFLVLNRFVFTIILWRQWSFENYVFTEENFTRLKKKNK